MVTLDELVTALTEELTHADPLVATERGSYLDQLAIAEAQLASDDRTGTFWEPSLVARARTAALVDRRMAFIWRLSRSAMFGQLVVQAVEDEIFACRDPLVTTAGRLVNVFITAFDGVCDALTEQLPVVVPSISLTLTDFPTPPQQRGDIVHPVAALTVQTAATLAELLLPAMSADAGTAADFSTAVARAYKAQLATMSNRSGASPEKSVATFAVALRLPTLVHRRPPLAAVEPLAAALGDMFGWIDDVVDMTDDAARGQPNRVVDVLKEAGVENPLEVPERAVHRLREETVIRWLALREAFGDARLQSDRLDRKLVLSLMSWLC